MATRAPAPSKAWAKARPNPRLLLTQMERILEINALQEVTKAVVEAARESLVIGEA
jgi:hypothetical protein